MIAFDRGIGDAVSVLFTAGYTDNMPQSLLRPVASLPLNGRLDEIVQAQLQAAGLWGEVKDRLKAPAAGLSVGQQQRLCLARALAVEPEILLCDESTSALDPISARAIEGLLHTLKDRYTIVMVTHVLHQARRLADHVIFLWLGEVVEQGPVMKVFEQPEKLLTQAYLAREIG